MLSRWSCNQTKQDLDIKSMNIRNDITLLPTLKPLNPPSSIYSTTLEMMKLHILLIIIYTDVLFFWHHPQLPPKQTQQMGFGGYVGYSKTPKTWIDQAFTIASTNCYGITKHSVMLGKFSAHALMALQQSLKLLFSISFLEIRASWPWIFVM